MMGVRTEEHCLRSQVGIGSELFKVLLKLNSRSSDSSSSSSKSDRRCGLRGAECLRQRPLVVLSCLIPVPVALLVSATTYVQKSIPENIENIVYFGYVPDLSVIM